MRISFLVLGLWLACASGASATSTYPILDPELQFVPIAPCRVFDTHTTGPIGGAGRSFFVSGTSGFEAQGGTAGGCGVPESAGAVAVSFTTSGSTKSGSIAVYPNGSTGSKNDSVELSFSAAIVDTTAVAVGTGAQRIVLRTLGGAVQVTGDITGYYVPQIEGIVFADGTYTAPRRVANVTHTSAGVYTVQFDRDVTYCSAQLSVFGPSTLARADLDGQNLIIRVYANNRYFKSRDDVVSFIVHC